MDICLGVALASAVVLRLPSPVTLSWTHSVEHFRIEEQWQAAAQGLVLQETRIEGLGAGVDLPADARRIGGAWHFTPALAPQAQVRLANSRFAAGYRVCSAAGCAALNDLAGGTDAVVTMTVCPH